MPAPPAWLIAGLALIVVVVPLVAISRIGLRAARTWLVAWLVPIALLLIVGLAGYLLLWYFTSWAGNPPKVIAATRVAYAEAALKTLAFAAAALFLLLKLAAGYGFSNAKLTTVVARAPNNDTADIVTVTTRIDSVGARSFQILDVKILRLDPVTAIPTGQHLPASGFAKTAFQGSQLGSEDVPHPLTLHPGDSIEVSAWAEIPSSEVLPVKIVVLGFASTALTPEQWTSAAVSPPDLRLRPKSRPVA